MKRFWFNLWLQAVADTIVGKPLGALARVGGVVTAIASMPFTIGNMNVDP